MSRTPETAPTTRADPAGRPLPAPHVRVAIALGSCVLGWLVAGAAAFSFERFLVEGGGAGSGDMLLFVLLIGLFAGGAWIVAVLPLVLFGEAYLHSLAGVVGAVTWTVYAVAVRRTRRRLEQLSAVRR